MRMKHPPHPGLSVRYDYLEPLGLSVAKGAKVLGVTRQAMHNLVSGKARISAEMAIRLEKAFGGGAETCSGCRPRTTLHRLRNVPAKLRCGASRMH
jgi:addiction module HigA family antidote